MSDARVRIAPSPTGPLHIGTARTALFNFLFARHVGGTFILRLEDTDQARSTVEFERDILEHLHWLGLEWDEGPAAGERAERGPFGPYRQMARLPRYAEAAAALVAQDRAYPCYCSPEELEADRKAQEAAKQPPRYVGRCAALTPAGRAAREAEGRRPALRFRIEPGVVAFDDLVRGHVEFDAAALGGDLVIVRGDGTPLYHFTVVVDDAAMGITHVIRGEDHLSNTPKHILLFRALGHPEPVFAHLPLILNTDRTKMSKRKSQTAVKDYIAEGFVREAFVNYLAYLGWSPGTEEDVLSLDEIVARFDLGAVQKGGAIFDRVRLEWLNGQWIRRLADDDLIDRLAPFLAPGEDGRADRPRADPRGADGAAPDRPGAAAGARRDHRHRRLPLQRCGRPGPRPAGAEALGARDGAGGPGGREPGARRRGPRWLHGRRPGGRPARRRRGERLEGRRPLHGDPGRADRKDDHAAPLRVDGRPRARRTLERLDRAARALEAESPA